MKGDVIRNEGRIWFLVPWQAPGVKLPCASDKWPVKLCHMTCYNLMLPYLRGCYSRRISLPWLFFWWRGAYNSLAAQAHPRHRETCRRRDGLGRPLWNPAPNTVLRSRQASILRGHPHCPGHWYCPGHSLFEPTNLTHGKTRSTAPETRLSGYICVKLIEVGFNAGAKPLHLW